MAGSKNRKNPRAHVALVARYRSPTAFEFVEEECVDLSSGGMFIKSKAPAPTGTLLKLECDVDHGKSTMRAVARVVWLRDRDTNDEPRGMGVKFVKLEPGARELIAQVLERVGGDDGAGPQARSSFPPPPGPSRLSTSAISLAPALMQQARVDSAAALPTALIEAKPPHADPAPAHARAADASKPKKDPAQKAAKPLVAAKAQPSKSDSQPRRSSAAPRSDVPTHRPPTQRGFDMRAIGIGALLLGGVAVVAMVTREKQQPPHPVSAEPAAQPASTAALPAQQTFELRLSTFPSEARITIGEHTGVSPLTIDLGTVTRAIDVRVEKDGFEPLSSSVELERFIEADGKRVATVMLALPALPREVAAEQANVNTAVEAKEPAAAPAPVPEPQQERAAAPAEKTRAGRSIAARRAAPKPEATDNPPEETAVAPSPPPPAAVVITPAPAPEPPAPAPVLPSPAPVAAPKPTVAPLPPTPSGGLTPMQTARACLARNDQACAVAALENRTRTAQELELLIETYRSMGRTDQTTRYMKLYVERYPTERRTAAYSAQLERPQ